ncbi:MAG: hypothetical protein IPK58_01560 [Acidobacteria bacterium]|nr:hypothetical protein [Acidobacteriota bacterium]
MSRLTRLKDTSQTATLFDRQYEYNNAKQIESVTEPGRVRNFSYDFVNRLTGMTSPTEPAESCATRSATGVVAQARTTAMNSVSSIGKLNRYCGLRLRSGTAISG